MPITGIRVNLYYCKKDLFGSGACDSVNYKITGNEGLLVFPREPGNRYNENPPYFSDYNVAAIKSENYTGSKIIALNANNGTEIILYPYIKKALYINSGIAYDKIDVTVYNDYDLFFLHTSKTATYNIKCVSGIRNTLSIRLSNIDAMIRDTSLTFNPALGDTSGITVNF